MSNHIENGCTRRRVKNPAKPVTDANIAKCGVAPVVYSIGDGHRSFYCAEHAPRDSQGYYVHPEI